MQPAVPSIAYKILNRLGIPLESRYLDDAKLGFQIGDTSSGRPIETGHRAETTFDTSYNTI